jgi:deoxycytidylate deaminase
VASAYEQTTIDDLLSDKPQDSSVATKISDRLSQELVIAFVGPVGSGVSTAAGMAADLLHTKFRYDVAAIIKVSSIIAAEAHRVGMRPPPRIPLQTYISEMQDAGNRLRRKYGNNYLTEKIVEKICEERKARGGYNGDVPLPGRRAYIIDSLKNPEELELLRAIYGDTLCVFGVFAPDAVREERLKNQGVASSEVTRIIDRDQGELPTFGQKTRKLFVHSDFFVCNDRRTDELRTRLERFFNIIFDVSVHTPTRAESAMYEASAAAANSACMSRQVGASIVSAEGELIAVGWNDVPRFKGGLYIEDDRYTNDPSEGLVDRDRRCYNWGERICHNESRRLNILDDLAAKITSAGLLKRGGDPDTASSGA